MTTIEKSQMRDLRLVLVTVLSGVYVVAFWALGRRTHAAGAPAASTVWYGDPPAAPVIRPVAQARPRRIRTRSS